jgi:hypothetical protein
VIYWAVTGLLALSALFAGVNYLWGGQQTVQTFAHLGASTNGQLTYVNKRLSEYVGAPVPM